MKIKKFVVADIVKPMSITQIGHSKIVDSYILSCRICRKEVGGYTDLESNEKFSKEQDCDIKRVEEATITPLSDYYNFLGMKKKNNHSNKAEVYEKVKRLKQEGKI